MTFSQLAGVNLEELQRLDFIKVVSVSGELGKSTERYLVLLITGLAEGAELKISLGVESQHVVDGKVEGLDWGFEFKSGVRSVPVVTVEPGLEVLLAVG